MKNVTYLSDHKARKEEAQAEADAREILGNDFDAFCAWTIENKHDLREIFSEYLEEREQNIASGDLDKVSPVAMCFGDIQLDAYLNA